jgi:hypothetical protein
MENPSILNDVETILKISEIASSLPKWAKDRFCHGVAIDITNYYFDLIQQAKAEVAREIFEEIESMSVITVSQYRMVEERFYQSLKSKYKGR